MFKSLFDSSADLCGAPNPLLTLSKNFGGQTNSTTAAQIQSAGIQNGGLSGSAVAPGDLLVQEYLAKVAQHTVPPSTFDMRQLVAQLPPLTMAAPGNEIGGKEMLERSWAELGERRNLLASEFLEKQQQNGLAQKWANEYSEENKEEMKSGGEKMETEWQIARTESTWAKDFLEDYEAKTAKAQEVEEPSLYNVYVDRFLEDYERYGPDYNPSDMTIPKFFDYELAWEHAKRTQENYQFLEANPYSGEQNALERAADSLGKGHLADSILHFEAALQREPSNPQIWYSLGLALAENEQDPRAITALQTCLKLEPQNEKAILALAVSLANESFEHVALQELEKWICVHQNKEMPEQSPPTFNMPLDRILFGKVEKEFLEAANRAANSPQMDPELQNALSVLYNLGNDFDRAVDCLRAALSLRPEDPILWNRLGATLANADRSAEAISAYKRALQMAPTYVRARYNLGTACMNLNSFRDAAAHFIAALQIQHSPNQSQIWSRLRSALIRIESAEIGNEVFDALERHDLPRIVQLLQAQGMTME